jgi:hypothetical protein
VTTQDEPRPTDYPTMTRTTLTRIDATQAAGALLVEECDVPEGMTLAQWRASETAHRRSAERERRGARRGLARLRLRRS